MAKGAITGLALSEGPGIAETASLER